MPSAEGGGHELLHSGEIVGKAGEPLFTLEQVGKVELVRHQYTAAGFLGWGLPSMAR